MSKTIIKEVIIVLLICIAIALLLGVIFYNYNPVNKVVPNKIAYTTSNEIKGIIGSENIENAIGEGFNVIYKIENADLQKYTKSDRYIEGKAHPFGNSSPSIGDQADSTISVPELEGDGGIAPVEKKTTITDSTQTQSGTSSNSNNQSGSGQAVTTPTPVKPK